MVSDLFFYGGLSLLIVHEMDAIRRQEWRMFPGLSRLSDENGYRIFTLLHIPILLFIFWGIFAAPPHFETVLIPGLNAFFIIHFFLHAAFMRHRQNNFNSAFSWSVISGVSLCGICSLLF